MKKIGIKCDHVLLECLFWSFTYCDKPFSRKKEANFFREILLYCYMEDISISGQKYLLPIIFVTLFCNDAIYWKSNTCSTILTKLLGVYVFLPRCINIFYPTYKYTSKPAKCVTGSDNNLQWRSDIFNLQMIKKWTHPTFTLVFLY